MPRLIHVPSTWLLLSRLESMLTDYEREDREISQDQDNEEAEDLALQAILEAEEDGK